MKKYTLEEVKNISWNFHQLVKSDLYRDYFFDRNDEALLFSTPASGSTYHKVSWERLANESEHLKIKQELRDINIKALENQ